MERRTVQSGTPWEPEVGYARAVRVGPHVWVAGTTATGEAGALVGAGDAYRQAAQALANVGRALRALDADFGDVVRTRLYVVDAARDAAAVGRAHAEVFGATRPAATLVEVRALIDPALLVEIEVEAYVVG